MGKWLEAERRVRCVRCPKWIDVGDQMWYARRGTYMCELCGSLAEHEEPEVGEIEQGVLEDLKQLPPEASDRTVAKMMVATARRVDTGDVADRDVAGLLKELRQMLMQLKIDYPPENEDDDTEKARKRREQMMLQSGRFDN